jgi:hypothetical protein
MMTDDGAEDVFRSTGPIYSLDAHGASEGPTCAQQGEFCFLCNFSASGEQDDPWSDTVDVIQTLAQEYKELAVIVKTIHQHYEANVRPTLSFTDGAAGVTIANPEWSKDAIQRHIIYTSSQWPQLFNNVCENIFVSMIALQSKHVKDLDKDEVDEGRRKALVDTMMQYSRFQHNRASSQRLSKSSK